MAASDELLSATQHRLALSTHTLLVTATLRRALHTELIEIAGSHRVAHCAP